MPSLISSFSIIIRERELTPIKEQEILSYLTRELGVDEVEIEHGLSILVIVGENMRDHIGVTATAAKALSEKNINLEMISQGSSEVSVMFVIETEQEKVKKQLAEPKREPAVKQELPPMSHKKDIQAPDKIKPKSAPGGIKRFFTKKPSE